MIALRLELGLAVLCAAASLLIFVRMLAAALRRRRAIEDRLNR